MTALALKGGAGGSGPGGGGGGGSRRRRSPVTPGRLALAGGVALVVFVIWNFLSAQIVTERKHEMKTTTVMLPPPPPPPPPPEVKPVEQPPQPTIAPPIEQPMDTPPPPDQAPSSDPSPGDNALSAREGAGPSNYGLAVGNGGGTRIGGRAGGGGDAFGAYAQVAQQCIRQAAQSDRELSRGRYAVRLAVRFDESGRIADVRVGDGDTKRQARIREVLTGLQCPQRPPAGMPVARIELRGG